MGSALDFFRYHGKIIKFKRVFMGLWMRMTIEHEGEKVNIDLPPSVVLDIFQRTPRGQNWLAQNKERTEQKTEGKKEKLPKMPPWREVQKALNMFAVNHKMELSFKKAHLS